MIVGVIAALVLLAVALAYVVALLREPVTVRPPSGTHWQAERQEPRIVDETDEEDEADEAGEPPVPHPRPGQRMTLPEVEANHQ